MKDADEEWRIHKKEALKDSSNPDLGPSYDENKEELDRIWEEVGHD
jgi:hypothetical protein